MLAVTHIGLLGPRSLNIVNFEYVPRLVVFHLFGLGSINVIVLNVVPNELRRSRLPILDVSQFVLRVEWVGGRSCCLKLDEVGLALLDVIVLEVVFWLI